jgi:hypothetical protein
MKPIQLLAAASLLASAPYAPALAQDASTYLDDRSSPSQLIKSLYNAINRKEFGRAYSYFSTPPAASFEAYEEGFAATEQVELLAGVPFEDPGAGTIHYTLPVAIRSTDTAGESRVFAGCYTLRLSSPSAQTTPYTPLIIDEGKLEPAEGELRDVLPERCSENEEPRDPVALMKEQAKEMFQAVFADRCNMALANQEEPEQHELRFRYSHASEGDPDEVMHLFRFFCDRGAYNEIHAYVVTDSRGLVAPVDLATPELEIQYEDDDSEKKATDTRIIGFQTERVLINSAFDPQTFTITSYAKWRGVGDAFSAGSWLFRQGKFSLVKYDVDPSYDGEIDPITVLDYDIAP